MHFYHPFDALSRIIRAMKAKKKIMLTLEKSGRGFVLRADTMCLRLYSKRGKQKAWEDAKMIQYLNPIQGTFFVMDKESFQNEGAK